MSASTVSKRRRYFSTSAELPPRNNRMKALRSADSAANWSLDFSSAARSAARSAAGRGNGLRLTSLATYSP